MEDASVPAPEPAPAPTHMDVSGILMDISGTPMPPPPPPPILTMNDIVNAREVILAKEASDSNAFCAIPNQSVDFMRNRMIEWAKGGFADAFTLFTIPVSVPEICSDGVTRSLTDYIEFVSGKPIQEHVAGLQTRLPDFNISFANFGGNVGIVVSKRTD